MNDYINFETVVALLTTAHLLSVIMLLTIFEAGTAIIEVITKLSDCN